MALGDSRLKKGYSSSIDSTNKEKKNVKPWEPSGKYV